ncbi:chorismate-binding protein, partial [Paracoccus sp. PXZ]
ADRRTPLMAFAVHDAPEPAPPLPAPGAARLAPLKPMISQQDYAAAFARTRDYIAAGDCYQINLTFPIGSRLISGSALELYAALAARQPVGFGAYADLGQGPVVVSRSPELFFRLDA